jgi:hypothetical protein
VGKTVFNTGRDCCGMRLVGSSFTEILFKAVEFHVSPHQMGLCFYFAVLCALTVSGSGIIGVLSNDLAGFACGYIFNNYFKSIIYSVLMIF